MAVQDGAHVRIAPGATLAGKYRLIREIGRGGVGVVYEAEHLKLAQRVAIKILSRSVLDEPLVCARFDREARAMASLRSPYVTLVTDVDVLADGAPYMVMELLDGRDLQRELRYRGALPAGEAVQIALLACRGLAAVHAAGIIHRDLKPSNLFLVKSGHEMNDLTVKVMDFGVSKMQGDVLVTHDGSTLGTPAYMAPEQVRSARDVDVRADVWSLGVILFRCLAGTLPFEGEGITGMAVAITNDPVKSLAALRPELPLGLVAVVERMLAKDVSVRFATIEDVAVALAAFGDAPFTEAATDPNLVLPDHLQQRLAEHAEGEHSTSHVRSSDAAVRRDADADGAADPNQSEPLASSPPRSRLLLFALPAALLVVLAAASVVTAKRVLPREPAGSGSTSVAASTSPSPSVASGASVASEPVAPPAASASSETAPMPASASAPSPSTIPVPITAPPRATRRREPKPPPTGLPPLL